MDQQVTLKDISAVSHIAKIQADWPQLADTLDPVMFNAGKIVTITENKSLVGRFMQVKFMLEAWRSHHASDATRRKLIEALCVLGWTNEAVNIFGDALVTLVKEYRPSDHAISEFSGRHRAW